MSSILSIIDEMASIECYRALVKASVVKSSPVEDLQRAARYYYLGQQYRAIRAAVPVEQAKQYNQLTEALRRVARVGHAVAIISGMTPRSVGDTAIYGIGTIADTLVGDLAGMINDLNGILKTSETGILRKVQGEVQNFADWSKEVAQNADARNQTRLNMAYQNLYREIPITEHIIERASDLIGSRIHAIEDFIANARPRGQFAPA